MTWFEERAREIVDDGTVCNCGNISEILPGRIAAAIQEAEAAGFDRGVEAAAKAAERKLGSVIAGNCSILVERYKNQVTEAIRALQPDGPARGGG